MLVVLVLYQVCSAEHVIFVPLNNFDWLRSSPPLYVQNLRIFSQCPHFLYFRLVWNVLWRRKFSPTGSHCRVQIIKRSHNGLWCGRLDGLLKAWLWLRFSYVYKELVIFCCDLRAFRVEALDLHSDRGRARKVVSFVCSLFLGLLLLFLTLYQLFVLRRALARYPLIRYLVYIDYVLLHEFSLQHGVLRLLDSESNRTVCLSLRPFYGHGFAERGGVDQIGRPHTVL